MKRISVNSNSGIRQLFVLKNRAFKLSNYETVEISQRLLDHLPEVA